MAKKQKPPVVVAELGRPETPAETSARKAADSRRYRQSKTVNNLVFSLLVSLGLVLVIVLAVPRGTDGWSDHAIDVSDAAAAATTSSGMPLLAPEVPDTWKAKQAELRTAPSGDITYWYIGYTTENEAYAAVVQAYTASGSPVDSTWIAQQLEMLDPTGTETIGGIEWTVYDHPKRDPDSSNVLFAMEGRVGDVTLLVYGTDTSAVLRTLTAAVAEQASATAADAAAATDPTAGAEADTDIPSKEEE